MKLMNIELSELGRHEAWLRLSSIMKAGDNHVQLERKLTSELIKNWRETYDDTLKELFSRLPAEISSEAIEIITQRLADALGQSFGSSQAVRDELRKYIAHAYESGKSEFAAKSDLNLPDIRAIDVLTKHNCYWLGEHYGKHIGPKIAELTQEALRYGLDRDELAKELRESLGGKVGGYKYWDVVSSAALVRSRSFGCISGMVEAGITEYEILAMGDERMCPICGELSGQTFSVMETREVIDRTLGISDPDKFKEAMPWHTEPPVGVGKDKLIATGMNIPPFHGRCRCVITMVSEHVEITSASFPNIKPEEVLSYNLDTRIARVSPHSMPSIGLPNWKYDKIAKKSGMTSQRRFFDSEGKVKLDVDFDNHGSPSAHPMGAHSHDYVSGKLAINRGLPRILKDWERKMMQEIQSQESTDVKKDAEDNFQFISGRWIEPSNEYITLEQYKRIMDIGGEYGFIYDGRGYFTSGFDNPSAWEWNNDESYREGFKDIDDMLDNYRVHTGETLREIIPKSMLEDSPVWPV